MEMDFSFAMPVVKNKAINDEIKEKSPSAVSLEASIISANKMYFQVKSEIHGSRLEQDDSLLYNTLIRYFTGDYPLR